MGTVDKLTKEVFKKSNVSGVEAALGVPVTPEDATKVIHAVHRAEEVKQRLVAEMEEWKAWCISVEGVDMSDAGSVPDGPDDALINELKVSVIITAQHAQSLTSLVQYFRNMMQLGYSAEELLGRVETPEGEHKLTSAYCDELLEDLGQ